MRAGGDDVRQVADTDLADAAVGAEQLELVVRLDLIHGLEQSELDAVLGRLAKRWAADHRIAVLVDSLTVKLVRA